MKAAMKEAGLYNKNNSLQRRDALICLDQYAINIRWKFYGDRILDIGCGDGSVTAEVLRHFVPENFKHIVGCDISEDMVQFAREHHSDPKLSFSIMDIAGEMQDSSLGAFDHAFSFYALHWVRKQEKAFSNIYNLLSENGDCLLLFLAHMPVFDVYRIMAENPRWNLWVKDVEKYISPYHDSENPDEEVKIIMKKCGFKEVNVECEKKVIVYNQMSILRKSVMAVNPFNIPKELQEEFMDDYLSVVRDLELMDDAEDNISVKADYTIIIAYGAK